MSKAKYVTEEVLEQKLDQRFAVFEKRLDLTLADFFGKMMHYLDQQLEARLKPIHDDLHTLFNITDAHTKSSADVEQEHYALAAQHDRYAKRVDQLEQRI